MRMLAEFEKRPRLRHLSHLDLQRTMQRALRCSGLPIAYSQGFHPHVLLSFASALSMGVPSRAEIMDVPLSQEAAPETFVAQLNAALPEALVITRAIAVPDNHPKLMGILKQASYGADLPGQNLADWQKAIDDFLEKEECLAERKSKRAVKVVNIRPMVFNLKASEIPEGIRLDMRLSLEEAATLKPEVLIGVLAQGLGIETPAYTLERIGLYRVEAGEAVSLLPTEDLCSLD